MPELLILVNGLPGSGKTTLARALGPALHAAVLSKDAIKEAVADAVGPVPGIGLALGGAAMETAWSLAAQVPDRVIVESWWFAPRDREFVRGGLDRIAPERAVEVWCEAPVDVVRERYRARERHPIHDDAGRLATDWETWAAQAAPLGLCPAIEVDTSGAVDVEALAETIDSAAEPRGVRR